MKNITEITKTITNMLFSYFIFSQQKLCCGEYVEFDAVNIEYLD